MCSDISTCPKKTIKKLKTNQEVDPVSLGYIKDVIKNNNNEGFLEVVRENAGKKIRIMNTTKDQRTWVYKIVTNVNDIDAWSLPRKGERVLVIMCAKKE